MAEKNNGLLHVIGEHFNSFSPKQRILAKYLIDNYLDLAYLTISEFAQNAGVSETTVVRFVYTLEFNSFAEFMAALRSEIENAKMMPPVSTSKHSWENGKYEFPQDVMRAIFSLEMSVMEELLARTPGDIFQKAVEAITSTSQLIIVGCSANKCLTQAAFFAFDILKSNVKIIENLDLSTKDLTESIPPNATCLAFSTPRYPKETQSILECLKSGENKPFVIGVTNSLLSPLTSYSDIVFQVPEKFVMFIDTNAAYMSLIHALAFAVYLKNPEYSKKRIEEYDSYVKKYNFYVLDRLDLIKF